MDWRIFVATRYLLRRKKENFVSIISIISILGIIVGVAALIVVISIMTGFDIEIKEKIIGTYSHIVITSNTGIADEDKIKGILKTVPHVVANSPFIDEQGFLGYGNSMAGVIVRGLDKEREPLVSNVRFYIQGRELKFGKSGIVVGSELAKELSIKKGDIVSLFSPYNRKRMEFNVVDTFTSGRYDYDAHIVFIELGKAKTLFGRANPTGIGVRVDNEFNVGQIKRILQRALGYPYIVRSWMDLDKNLMQALAMEKKMMFIILSLIVLVACFNIASSLIMQVLEKTKDIGILRAIGATANSIKTIFIFLGFMIGWIGVIFGTGCGIAIAYNINEIADFIETVTGFELFPSDIYYLARIPVRVVPQDIISIASFALLLAVFASLYPAWKASRLNPVEAIRYE